MQDKLFDYLNLQDDGIYMTVKKDEYRIASRMWIEEERVNIDDNSITLLLKYERRGEECELRVQMEDLFNTTNIMKLQRYGLDVLPSNAKHLINYFRDSTIEARKQLVHNTLGFGTYKNELIYKHFDSKVGSQYIGDYDIEAKGSKEKWVQMFQTEVLGHAPLELICVTGLSAVLIGYMGNEIGVPNLITHLMGNSTTGKSTALKLAISMFSNPLLNKRGLFNSYNATENALNKILNGLIGMPVAFDELATSGINDFTKMIHKFSQGVDKKRLSKNAEFRETGEWNTTILSNGERSLVDSSSKDVGIQVRVYEYENVTWTKSAKNAEAIDAVITKNYGHIGVEFAELIMETGKDNIREYQRKMVDTLIKIFQINKVSDDFTARRVKGYAVLLTTARYLERLLEVKLDKRGMIKMFVQLERQAKQARNFDIAVIDYIKHYVLMNQQHFQKVRKDLIDGKALESNQNMKVKLYGRIIIDNKYEEYQFNPLAFKQMLEEGKFKGEKVVLKSLKESGYLVCEDDRYTLRKTVNGTKQHYYVVRIPK